jgi:hypothetical protein
MPDGRKRWTLTMGSSTSLLPTAIFLLLFSACQPDLVGECVAGLTLLWQQSDIAPSFSRLLRISSRATVRRNPGEPFLLARFRARGDASKNSYRTFEGVSRDSGICYRMSGSGCPVGDVR